MSWCRKATSLLVFSLMGLTSASVYDDYLIYKQCSNKALERARHDRRLTMLIGEHIQQGPWYDASLGIAHEGHSASCSFPVKGSRGSANLHLRAVRYEERLSSPYYYVWPGSGTWEMLVLEALVPPPPGAPNQHCPFQNSWMLPYIPNFMSTYMPGFNAKWELITLQARGPTLESSSEVWPNIDLLEPIGPSETNTHHEV